MVWQVGEGHCPPVVSPPPPCSSGCSPHSCTGDSQGQCWPDNAAGDIEETL